MDDDKAVSIPPHYGPPVEDMEIFLNDLKEFPLHCVSKEWHGHGELATTVHPHVRKRSNAHPHYYPQVPTNIPYVSTYPRV